MDDLMYRYNNQNSIYVLNSSFNSYGEFGRLNLIACPQLNPTITNDDRSANCPESQLSALTSNNNNNNNGCSSVTRSLQHKLKTLGSLSATAEGIGNSGVASSMSLSSSASSAVTCSPAAAALQKLFNCTSVVSNINSCNNSGNCNSSSSCSMGSSNNIRDCLSATDTDAMRDSGAILSNASNSNNNSGNSSSGNSNNNNNKKKCANVKSTLIAKKTKFLKYLEEEKWRAHDDSIENLSTTNCERNRGDSNNIYSNSTALRGSSTAYNAILTSSASSTTGGSFHDNSTSNSSNSNSNNHYGSILSAAVNTTVAKSSSQQQQQQQQQLQQQPQHQQYKSNNWSGNHDSNNQKQQKTSSELYKEAAELLGLSCTLCDNCRCLDCQSGYFDCDDSDSYSELSFMDEYDEVGTAPATTSVFMMHADYEYENDTEQQHKEYTQQQQLQEQQTQQQQLDEEHAGQQQQQHFLACNGADCNNDYSVKNAGNIVDGSANETATTTTTRLALAINAAQTVNLSLTDNEMSNNDRCAGTLDTGLMSNNTHSINTQQPLLTASQQTTAAVVAATLTAGAEHQLNELEHCASFNELSLMDASRQEKTHDCLWAERQQQHVVCGSK